MLSSRRKNREMKRLITKGAEVWMEWFYSKRHLPGTDEELARFARKVLPVLGSMGDMAARERWIESDNRTYDLE